MTTTNLGELISCLYEEFMNMYGDEELASVAVAATVNELLMDRDTSALPSTKELMEA